MPSWHGNSRNGVLGKCRCWRVLRSWTEFTAKHSARRRQQTHTHTYTRRENVIIVSAEEENIMELFLKYDIVGGWICEVRVLSHPHIYICYTYSHFPLLFLHSFFLLRILWFTRSTHHAHFLSHDIECVYEKIGGKNKKNKKSPRAQRWTTTETTSDGINASDGYILNYSIIVKTKIALIHTKSISHQYTAVFECVCCVWALGRITADNIILIAQRFGICLMVRHLIGHSMIIKIKICPRGWCESIVWCVPCVCVCVWAQFYAGTQITQTLRATHRDAHQISCVESNMDLWFIFPFHLQHLCFISLYVVSLISCGCMWVCVCVCVCGGRGVGVFALCVIYQIRRDLRCCTTIIPGRHSHMSRPDGT